ncbi:MAG: nitrogenase component 1 [Peptococcaceae bacterium]|jgi:nitrogenase molybdenum-iron protein alpha/beta subunit|nr:nitrogenase component 1 [Peptococcaceae bacterium]
MTDIRHLKRLAAVQSMNGVGPLTPAAFPGNHCPMHTALGLGTRIKNVSTLVVGTAECGYYSRNLPLASPFPEREQGLHWTYVLDGREVVFGFRDGLISAVKEMDAAGAKVILLLITCVPELIGEDIESVRREIQPQISARLLYIPLGNFKYGSYQPGYWQTLLAMGKLIKKTARKTGTVNILGRSPGEDHIPRPELIALLARHHIPLRFIAPDASIEDFAAAGGARMNLVLSPFLEPLAEWMREEHGVPFFSLHSVYDADEIRGAYRSVGELAAIETDIVFQEAYRQAKKLQEAAKSLFGGKCYIGANIGAIQPFPLAAYLSGLGLSPVMLNTEDFYPSDKAWKDRLVRQNENPVLCLLLNEQADGAVIKELGADVILGDWGGRAETAPPTAQIMDLYGYIGYERTAALLNRIVAALPRKEGDSHNGTV